MDESVEGILLPTEDTLLDAGQGIILPPAPPPAQLPKPSPVANESVATIVAAEGKLFGGQFSERYQQLIEKAQLSDGATLYRDTYKQAVDERYEDLSKATQAIAAQGNEEWTTFALEEAKRAKAIADGVGDASPLTQSREVAESAVENMSVMAGKLISDPDAYHATIKKNADSMATRQLLLSKIENLDKEETKWEAVKDFGGSMVPMWYRADVSAAIKKLTGIDAAYDNKKAYRVVVDKLSTMSTEEASFFIDQLTKEIVKEGNKEQAKEFLTKLYKGFSPLDAFIEDVFEAANLLIVGDINAITRGLVNIIRRGMPAKVLAETAGTKEAGTLVGKELTGGGRVEVSGLSKADQAETTMSFADTTLIDKDKGKFRGASAGAQEEFEKATRQLIEDTKSRLISSGRTQEEITEAVEAIKRGYSPSTNKSIHSVSFAEPTELNVRATVTWQGPDGSAFLTRESAEAFARERGRNVSIVPNTTNTGFYVDESVLKNLEQKRDALSTKLQDTTTSPIDEVRTSIATGVWSEKEALSLLKKAPRELDNQISKEQALIKLFRESGDSYKVAEHADNLANLKAFKDRLDEAGLSWEIPFDNMPMRDRQALEEWADQFVDFFQHSPESLMRVGVLTQKDLDDMAARNIKEYAAIKELEKHNTSKPSIFSATKGSGITVEEGLAYSKSIGKNTAALINDWRKMFGVNDRTMLLHFDDLQDLDKFSETAKMLSSKDVQHTLKNWYGWEGFQTRMPVENVQIIVMRGDMKRPRTKQLGALAHEFGHVVDSVILRRSPAYRAALLKEFETWASKKYPNSLESFEGFKEYLLGFRRQDALFEQGVAGTLKQSQYTTMEDMVGLLAHQPSHAKWLREFDEFWAEQFAKYALTKGEPSTAIGKYFAEVRDAIVRLYQSLVERFGKESFSTAPQKAVADFLDALVANKGRLDIPISRIETTLGKNIPDNVRMSLSTNTPKPHIKLKTEQQQLADLNARIAAMKEEKEVAKYSSGWLVRETIDEPLPLHTVGKYDRKDIESMPFIAIDPKHSASELAVEERVIGIHAESKMKNDMTKYLKTFWGPLSSKEKAAVHNVLVKGDAYSNLGGVGKEFGYTELVAEGLNEKQAMAYFAVRQLRDFMHTVRDGEMVRSLRSKGYTETVIKLGPEDHFVSAGKRVDPEVLKNKSVYVPEEGKSVVMTEEKLKGYLDGGYVPIETLEKATGANGKAYTRFLVKPDDMYSRPIVSVLPKRPGEYSRIYTDEYFIQLNRTAQVNDETVRAIEHIRTAPSKRLADEFVNDMNVALKALKEARDTGKSFTVQQLDKLVGKHGEDAKTLMSEFNEGVWDDVEELAVHYNRMKDDFVNAYTNKAASEGRMFVSKRGERLPSVATNHQNTLDVFDSLSAEMSNTARFTNINAWKEASIQRWYNAFADKVDNATGDAVQDFFKFTSQKYVGADTEMMFAQRTHKYIMDQLSVNTREENYYKAITKQLTEKWFSGNTPIETVGAAIRNQSLIGFLRSANFHLNLGMFNPAQLLVQANGASAAMILHPIHGLKAAKTFPLLRMALMSDNPEVWKHFATAQKLSDLGLSSTDEFIELVKGIRKSGILDGIQSTSLYNIEDGKFDVFKNFFGKAKGQSPFFFNRGEEFARVVAFDVSRREWMAANPGKAWNTDSALKHIVIRQDDLTQNMTKANLAGFQKGVLSIPMQFAQYNVKLAANILSAAVSKGNEHYRGFTRAEALQLMLGHIVLYGAAGNGTMMLVEAFGEQVNELSEEARTYIVQGSIAGLLNSFALAFDKEEGMNVGLGSRLGTFDYYERIAKALFTDETKLYDALLGPTAGNARRLGVVGDVVKLWHYNPALTADDVLDGIQRMSVEQVSTLRNVSKAYLYYMHEGKVVDGKGNALARINKKEMLAQALGFAPSAQYDVTTLFNDLKKHKEALDGVADLLYATQKQMVVELSKNTPEGDKRAEELNKVRQALMPENAGDRETVLRNIRERVFPYDTTMQKLLSNYLMQGRQDRPVTVKNPNERTE